MTKGLSTKERILYWSTEAELKKIETENIGHYWKLQTINCLSEKQILKDIDRTFPHLECFNKSRREYKALHRILKAVALHIKDVGYCQGINFLAATIYLNLSDEESTFWMLAHILQEDKYKKIFLPGLKRLSLTCYQFDCLVRNYLPRLADFFVFLCTKS